MLPNSWFKKEKPFQGLMGAGGGVGGSLQAGGFLPGIEATGGDNTNTYEVDGQAYKCHIFASSGSLVVSDVGSQGAECEFVVVGGGGGAANQHSGGGGAQSSGEVGTAPFSSPSSTQSTQPAFNQEFCTHPIGAY